MPDLKVAGCDFLPAWSDLDLADREVKLECGKLHMERYEILLEACNMNLAFSNS
jgi:hypothetical protein